jgi:hypothetical protein
MRVTKKCDFRDAVLIFPIERDAAVRPRPSRELRGIDRGSGPDVIATDSAAPRATPRAAPGDDPETVERERRRSRHVPTGSRRALRHDGLMPCADDAEIERILGDGNNDAPFA